MATAEEAFTAWQETDLPYSGQGHRRNMLSARFNRIGIGCARVGNMTFWAQALAKVYTGEAPGAANDEETVVTVQTDESLLTLGDAALDPMTLRWGETAAEPGIPVILTPVPEWAADGCVVPGTLRPGWVSDDPLCVTVADGQLTGSALGGTTLRASVLEEEYTLPVTVSFQGRLPFSFRLPEDLAVLEQSAFENTAAVAVCLPAGLETVKDRAFAACAGLRQVTFLSGSASLEGNPFEGCGEDITVFCPAGSPLVEELLQLGVQTVPFR